MKADLDEMFSGARIWHCSGIMIEVLADGSHGILVSVDLLRYPPRTRSAPFPPSLAPPL
ncbi:MAG: hypothetical protein ACI9MC_003390 [Kiritimatiellia bacterium]